jgi:phosphoglucosamine mutase
MRKLFGTDGIRGVAGAYPLDRRTVHAVGRALGHHLPAGPRRVVIGQDTRESSSWLADTLSSGLRDTGTEAESAGVITTPGIAYLTHTHSFSAGVVVSASHNPWQDNGIKVFGPDGYKLPDRTELEIEDEIFAQLNVPEPVEAKAPIPSSLPGNPRLCQDYIEWMAGLLSHTLRVKVVVDCANGAASNLAPEIFRRCGIQAQFIHHQPDGRNINEHCGALHPEVVARETHKRGADVGVCFDGDADRVLFADHNGDVVNGDAVLFMLAGELHRQGRLPYDMVVATTMSNMGLETALRSHGICMRRAQVGDKYVLEEMKKTGAILGGEQSGHIILSEVSTTGDGLLTALKVLEIISCSGNRLAEMVADLKVFPQIIRNVRVREKRPLDQIPAVKAAIDAAQDDLNASGRVVVRYSGTETLARVMIEAESKEKIERHAQAIASAIEEALGV